jgi:hypothetical protein
MAAHSGLVRREILKQLKQFSPGIVLRDASLRDAPQDEDSLRDRQHHRPHGEEPRISARRLEPWMQVLTR